MSVKKDLAGSIVYLAPVIGKINTTQYLIDVLKKLYEDNDSQVKIEIIKNILPLAQVLTLRVLLQQILPMISQLLNDTDWSIRKKTLLVIGDLYMKLDESEKISSKLLIAISQKLKDKVFNIR